MIHSQRALTTIPAFDGGPYPLCRNRPPALPKEIFKDDREGDTSNLICKAMSATCWALSNHRCCSHIPARMIPNIRKSSIIWYVLFLPPIVLHYNMLFVINYPPILQACMCGSIFMYFLLLNPRLQDVPCKACGSGSFSASLRDGKGLTYVCRPCAPGYAQPSGASTACEPCPVGEYQEEWAKQSCEGNLGWWSSSDN